MKTCPQCGASGSDEMKFCPICGTALNKAEVSAAAPVIPVAQPASAPSAPSAPTPPPITPPTAPAGAAQGGQTGQAPKSNVSDVINGLNNTADTTADYDAEDIKNNTVMGILAYLGILVLIPAFAAKESRFARFHANQGMVLFIAEIAFNVARWIILKLFWLIFGGWAGWIYSLVDIVLKLFVAVFALFVILGIINVANGKAKELPIIGKFRILN